MRSSRSCRATRTRSPKALALQVIRTVTRWLPRAVADGADIEARSELLIASHLAGLGQASGTGVGLVHALGHAIGSRGRLAHGLALAVVLPEVLAFYAVPPGRDQEMTLIGRAMGTASPPDATVATAETIDALRSFLDGIGLRPRLRDLGFDAASLDVVAADAVADPAILNAPRIPSVTEARAILEAVL